MMRVSILTVSDSSSMDKSLDRSGPILIELLRNSPKLAAKIVCYSIVPDEQDKIEQLLRKYCTLSDVILTTGGTGLSKRDVTPEATKRVIEREVNGISTALLISGLKSTPFAALSRLVAGTVGQCLIVNLPGSRNAVREGFSVLESILNHAVSLIKEEKTEVDKTHKHILFSN